jgi:dipeptidyl-peptidase-4
VTSQWFAEQGFAVLVADGRGTPGRGPVWEREVYGDVLGPALEDQVAALTEAARSHPDLDLGRVGIRGWSFGGSLAALAVLRRPDVFHAAGAGPRPLTCGCTTPTGGSGSTATQTGSRSGTRRSHCCARRQT